MSPARIGLSRAAGAAHETCRGLLAKGQSAIKYAGWTA
jgi:hypothetical protein